MIAVVVLYPAWREQFSSTRFAGERMTLACQGSGWKPSRSSAKTTVSKAHRSSVASLSVSNMDVSKSAGHVQTRLWVRLQGPQHGGLYR